MSEGNGSILITDIGSTTTKGLLLVRQEGVWRVASDATVPTTVEKPLEDVCIGVRTVADALGRQTGLSLLDTRQRPSVPYVTTSSAGGGLQMLVLGLTSTDTGRIAELAAQGAGGVILRTFTIDDGTPVIHKMRLMKDLHPDLILMAGGIDGGDIANVVRLAEILCLAKPTPKFDPQGRIPLVFCGNVDAREYVAQVLASRFDVTMVDNIRPTLTDTNLRPAREAILRLFMHTVMERAPGYATLKTWVTDDIIPTPVGVERILERYARAHGQNVVMVDMGGATTDVFSNIYGEYRRTVAANIGVSYSICNVIAREGIDAVMRHLPGGITEGTVRDYAASKMLNPARLPSGETELLIEWAVATVGIGAAWRQHQDMNFTVAKVGLLDRLRRREDFDPFQETFQAIDTKAFFHVSDIDLIIGTGGVISHAPPREAVRMLVEGFLPTGITKLAVDGTFRSPHLGAFASVDAEAARALFERECLRDSAYVVAPTGEAGDGVMLHVRNRATGLTADLRHGDVRYAPEGGDWDIVPGRGFRLYERTDGVQLDTALPVLFDCRGRGGAFTGTPLRSIEAFRAHAVGGISATRIPRSEVVTGPFEIRRELPYHGTIFVHAGERVAPEDPVGENVLTPPRVFIIDVHRLIGYHRHLKSEDIVAGILVKEGDDVSVGQRIFRGREAFFGMDFFCNSPVRGTVTGIEANGSIILREIQDYARKPVRINIAEALGIPPRHIRNRLEFRVGDFVQKGQELVKGSSTQLPVRAPRSGTLVEVNTDDGSVVVHYDLKPVVTRAVVAGTVTGVEPGHAVTVSGHGTVIRGAIGFGGECFGRLAPVAGLDASLDEARDGIVASVVPVDGAFLARCASAGVRGVIAPSVAALDWVVFAGREIGAGSTGDEDVRVRIVLTEGFGSIDMTPASRDLLERSRGASATLLTRTQIRAGVIRPLIIITDGAP